MSIFTKNKVLLELINKFNHMENKIDILNSKFESMTFLDGCCNCQQREKTLFNDLQTFFEDELLKFQNSLLKSIQKENQENKKDDYNRIKTIIETVCEEYRSELHTVLEKCTLDNNKLKTDVVSQIKNIQDHILHLSVFVQNFKQEKNNQDNLRNTQFKESDMSLRTDLQTFLVGLQSSINTVISNNKIETINHITNNKPDNGNINDLLKKIHDLSQNINTNVKSFYYDNEIIKHQIMLEEELQKYNDEIDNIRTLSINVKNSVEETLSTFKHLN
jgi:hypothetical protein